MTIRKSHIIVLLIAGILLPIIAILHLNAGIFDISITEFWDSIFNYKSTEVNQSIARNFRIPRLAMAAIAGAGLSIAGLLMQTLFNNPLAGPYVLGINSGASLFVAFGTMTGIPFFFSEVGNVGSALIGALIFGFIILVFSRFVKSHISLLLIGLMLGSFTSAIVALLTSISDMQSLKSFTMWSLGSLQNVGLAELKFIITLFLLGVLGSLLLVKPLNNLILGEQQAKLLGIKIKRLRLLIILITALFTGLITAYCGPISFVGLAVPNIVRIAFKTQNHFILILGCVLFGALFVLLCDLSIQYLESFIHIPINVLTAIIGAPFVVFIVLKKLT